MGKKSKWKHSKWKLIYVSGWVVTGFGMLGALWHSSIFDQHFDLGVVIGCIGILFSGLFATVIAQSLRYLEERLDQMTREETLPKAR